MNRYFELVVLKYAEQSSGEGGEEVGREAGNGLSVHERDVPKNKTQQIL